MSEATVVTSENSAEFYAQKIGLADTEAPSEAVETQEVEAEPQVEEQSEPEAEVKEATAAEKKQNPKLERRFSDLTHARDEARKEAQREREAREALEARLKALETKSAPPRVEAEEDSEPRPEQFSDPFEYAKALAEYSTEKALKDRDRAEADRRVAEQRGQFERAWAERVAAAKSTMPDFDDMINSSDVMVSDPVRDAIMESDVGPQILYHLAENPDLGKKLGEMSVIAALRHIGKLEVQFEKTEPKKPVVAKSKAPAPISPIKVGASAADVPVDSDGKFYGSYQAYRTARLAGKIR
jgi:hypothetical protein